MHEKALFKNMFRYLGSEESRASRKIRKLCVSVSEFGGIKTEHFLEHYRNFSAGTRWEDVEIELKMMPYGPEFEITRIDFE